MQRDTNLVGKRFGRLVVTHFICVNKHKNKVWDCLCACGTHIQATTNQLQTGHTKSCGCLRKEVATCFFRKHSMKHTRLYNIWCGMHNRCQNPNNMDYSNYGGRGISFCNEWKDFLPFYDWAISNGYTDKLTLDRIDTNANYCPENCRWVDRIVQGNNKRNNLYLTYNGETHTAAEWGRITGISRQVIRDRIKKYKWTVEKALTTPVIKGGFHEKKRNDRTI